MLPTKFNDTWIFNLDKLEWREITTFGNIPSPRYFHTSCIYMDNMYIFGG